VKWNESFVSYEGLNNTLIGAGKILLEMYQSGLHEQYKTDGSFATEADLASEKFLIEGLIALRPDAGIWAEESGNNVQSGQNLYWVIDPLDGTNNYAAGIPIGCISVALVQDGEPVVGMIYDFHRGDVFAACKECGSYCNGKPIFISKKNRLNDAMVAIPVPYRERKTKGEWVDFWRYVQAVSLIATVRVYGSTALDLAYVAAGKIDAALVDSLSWWDVAAGVLLVVEAGGVVTTYSGDAVGSSFHDLVATGHELYGKIVPFINGKI
jgi:myo-inositol-1(or 4)-monophosphatase